TFGSHYSNLTRTVLVPPEQSIVPFLVGVTRTNFPPLTRRITPQPLTFRPPTSVGPSMPSAVKSWILAASSRNRARVRPLLPSALTPLFPTSPQNTPA